MFLLGAGLLGLAGVGRKKLLRSLLSSNFRNLSFGRRPAFGWFVITIFGFIASIDQNGAISIGETKRRILHAKLSHQKRTGDRRPITKAVFEYPDPSEILFQK